MLTAEGIRHYELRKAAMGGYRTEEVEELIEEVAATVEKLTAQNQESLAKIGVLAQKIEEYRQDEASIHEALLKAQKLGDQLVRDAEKKAAGIVNAAQFKAETTIAEAEANAAELSADAKAKADELLTSASAESDRTLKEAKTNAGIQLADAEDKSKRMLESALESVRKQQALFDHIKGEIAIFRSEILEKYKQQMDKITLLPDQVDTNPQSLADIISAQPIPEPAPLPVPEPVPAEGGEGSPDAAPAAPDAAGEAAGRLEESDAGEVTFGGVIDPEAAQPAEQAPPEDGFRIMIDEDEEDEDDRQATLTFGDEDTKSGFIFKK